MQTASNLTRKLMAMDKESDVKVAKRRSSKARSVDERQKFKY